MRRDGDRALLLMAHGTQDPDGRHELSELEAAVQAAAAWPVALGVLENDGAVGRTSDRLFCDPEKLARIAHQNGLRKRGAMFTTQLRGTIMNLSQHN